MIFAAKGLNFRGARFSAVGDVHTRNLQIVLSFLKCTDYIGSAAGNACIAGVFCTEEIAGGLPAHLEALVCNDPNWAFFTLVDFLAGRRQFPATRIDESAITGGAHVAGHGVAIAVGVRLDTFEHQRTSQGMISPRHDGELIVEPEVEIGANATTSKGFSYRATIIRQAAKMDAGVYVRRGAHIGRRAIICAGSRIMGHAVIGDDTFIGPGATVSSRVRSGDGACVSIGSVVTRDVGPGEVVTGNFAIPHEKLIRSLKASTGKAIGEA